MLRYAITDRGYLSHNRAWSADAMASQVELLTLFKADYVQVREKDLPFAEAVALAVQLQSAILLTGGATRVLLNTAVPPDPLMAWPQAIGIHIPSSALSTWADAISSGNSAAAMPVSASCHSVEEARIASTVAQVLLFAPVFEKRIHGDLIREGAGLEMLAEVCQTVSPLPVLAMGGVHWANAATCMAAGAAGVAGIRLFQKAGSVLQQAS